MPLCGCLPCCYSDDDDGDFIEIDKILIDHAKSIHMDSENRRFSRFRPKREFVVQWDHLHVSSELEEFVLQPHDYSQHLLQENLNKLSSPNAKNGHPANTAGPSTAPQSTDSEKGPDEPIAESPVEGQEKPKNKDGSIKQPDDAAGLSFAPQSSDSGTVSNEPNLDGNKKTEEQKGKSTSTRAIDTSDEHSDGETTSEKTPLTKGNSEKDGDSSGAPAIKAEAQKGGKQAKKSNPGEGDVKSSTGSSAKDITSSSKKKQQKMEKDSIEMIVKAPSSNITITKQTEGITGIKHQKLTDKIPSRTLCMYRTEYTNTSGQAQSFTFQTEKRTKSSVNIRVQRSCKIGGKIRVGLKLPVVPEGGSIDPLNVTGEMSKEFQWTRSKSDTKEYEEVWSVNNAVTVPHNTTTVAELKVHEEEATAFFRVKHKVTPIFTNRVTQDGKPLAQDNIPIYIYPKSEMKKTPEKRKEIDCYTISKYKENNGFCDAFLKYNNGQLGQATDEPKEDLVQVNISPAIWVNKNENYIQFETEGFVNCVYQAKQVINVDHTSLAESQEAQTDVSLKPDEDLTISPVKG